MRGAMSLPSERNDSVRADPVEIMENPRPQARVTP